MTLTSRKQPAAPGLRSRQTRTAKVHANTDSADIRRTRNGLAYISIPGTESDGRRYGLLLTRQEVLDLYACIQPTDNSEEVQ